MKKSLAIVLVCVLSTVLAGCPSQSELAALVSILGVAASSVAEIQGDSAVAQRIDIDSRAASAAIASFQPGSPAQNAVQAISLLQTDISLIPLNDNVRPYVDLALGTAQSIIGLLQSQGQAIGVVDVSPVPQHAPRGVRQVDLPVVPTTAKQFKAQWNARYTIHPVVGLKPLE